MEKKFTIATYSHFKESDFLSDAYFQEWVYTPTPENEQFWQEVIDTYPQQKTTIQQAHLYLRNISFQQHQPSEDAVEASLQRHLQLIQGLQEVDTAIPQKPRPALYTLRNLLKVAAVIGGMLLLAYAYRFYQQKYQHQIAQTGFGEIRHVILPDGSAVDLNANSSITYNKEWKPGQPREVWLNGEALFEVVHLNKDPNKILSQEKFLVHTKDLTVTVLGTVFDIRQRRSKTEVVLQSGKISLSFNDGTAKDILMSPGEVVAYNDAAKKITTETVAPEKFTAWKNHQLILTNPSVNDILAYLEDNFGRKIIVEDKQLTVRTINGPILLTSLDDALFVLSTVLNTEIVKKDSGAIIMRPRVHP
ncbi:FecR family protein [Chitinophaga arvensicola]|uniref:Ferric-dicitrate binding protein FerR, regulates iron transport through sigma-19 n=1 Tax=Chitinophaga arvensicola TaxID=29529 RepID=A0A1I0S908_9BACT|nr:FecR domain-containing protein [Chitinophaga arvensicola]SEW52657.1 ferric-dicitrate binding protein FerR, regulates iron transport through sigma-19 [Chitinophaga arvensicola]